MIVPLLLACTAPTAPNGAVDSAADTADTADTADVKNYVVTSYTVADRGVGFDFDGDGEIDNAIWALGGLLDPQISEAIAVAQHVVIQQVNDIHDWSDDDTISVGVLTATDDDGDGTDNGSGTDVYDAGAQVDADGNAIAATDTALIGGSYAVSLATGPLTVGAYVLELATGLFVDAAITPVGESGRLGFGISIEKLEVALEAEGASEDVVNALAGLADLDLAGEDGIDDAISMAFQFEAAACVLAGK